ncbi:MAG: nodulation protein NfeD, partial [Desulfuromonadales bacterium]|nr:nodulation protein NfeD [Desulfuromonadales bacterium]NIR34007.1 nodulation protein NfeD [Desulfuromonadales bacterium]NIS42679.1 nodulation protein NfeD [Desulfuromonadales bacterium]
GIVGETGQAVTDIETDGRVFVHGEYWSACSEEPVSSGETVEVVRVDRNMKLYVRKRGQT